MNELIEGYELNDAKDHLNLKDLNLGNEEDSNTEEEENSDENS